MKTHRKAHSVITAILHLPALRAVCTTLLLAALIGPGEIRAQRPTVPSPATGPASPAQDRIPSRTLPLPGSPNNANRPLRPAMGPAITPKAQSGADDNMVLVQFAEEAEVFDVLRWYEQMTGKYLILDANLKNAPALRVNVLGGKMPRQEAIRYVEALLQVNGITLIQKNDTSIKVIYAGAGKTTKPEGLPIYTSPDDLPGAEQTITYYMVLRNIPVAEANKTLTTQLGDKGSIVEVPNAQALIITGTVSAIRPLLMIQSLIDVPAARVERMVIQLHRADAERVSARVMNILKGNSDGGSGSAATRPQGRAQPTQTAHTDQPTVPVLQPKTIDESIGMSERSLVSGRVQLMPDPRTNRIVVFARPSDFALIEELIQTFDEPATVVAPYEHNLKFALAADILPVLTDVLTEGQETGSTGPDGAPARSPINRENPSRPSDSTGRRSSSRTGGTGVGGQSISGELELSPTDTAPEVRSVGNIKIIADNRANSLLVIGPPESIARARSVICRLDVKPRQVYLRTVIGQLSVGNETEFGVDFLQKFARVGKDSGVASAQRTTDMRLVDPASLIATGAFPALTTGLSGYVALGKTLDVYIKALEGTTRFKVISRPSLYATNNKKAVILSGQEIPVPTNTLSNSSGTVTDSTTLNTNIEYKDVTLELAVIPLINADGKITLSIVQKNDNLNGSVSIAGNQSPIVSTQKIQTNVTVGDNQTVVLGGLIIDEDQRDTSGIPYISRLPIIGNAFKNTAKNKRRQELIILIQPTVINDDLDLMSTNASERQLTDVAASTPEYTQYPIPKALPVETPAQRRKRKDFRRENFQPAF
ncbi:MAG TPA: secretin N-terminal domain-containing protein [Candidatus Methylacidiphilales bacterium]|nr:secretin N-terminal domain-containing protein [Candidatus Methylacidiphilales bacterium]